MIHTRRTARHLALLAALGAYACDTGAPTYTPAAVRARSTAFNPTADAYFAAPWPDDRRLQPDGTVPTLDFPNPREGQLFSVLLRTAHGLSRGWGMSSPIYVPFDGAIDPATLPADAPGSLSATAGVLLFAVDPASPAYRQRIPVEARWHEAATLFLPGHVLAVRPLPGFPLLPGTKYALVVTTTVEDPAGNPVGPDEPLFRALVTPELSDEATRAHFAPLASSLEALKVPPARVAAAVVFTTQPVFAELDALRATVLDGPAPTPPSITQVERPENAGFTLFTGTYDAPRFQHGAPPYLTEGGEFQFDAAGRAIPFKTEQIRFALCVPDTAPPATGFPIVFFSHGTGGSPRELERDDTCADLTSAGLAVLGIEQVLHGPRADGATGCFTQPVEECFFNVVNAVAGRNTVRQSAVDHLWLRRVAEGFTVPPSVDPLGRTIRFDSRHPGFFGHSQGALTGALYAAMDPALAGAVLSAAGGHVSTSLLLRDGGRLRALVEGDLFLNLGGEESLDAFHPALALMQALAEPADPLNYAPRWLRTPEGRRKHVWLTSGLDDPATPAATTVALAVAGGVPQLVGGATTDAAFELAGLVPVPAPARGNIAASGAWPAVTAVLRQFPDEGHFPIFEVPSARVQLRGFFTSLAAGGDVTLPAGD